MSLIFNQDAVREPLYVVVPYSNQWRWKSRTKHTQRAIKHYVDSGATVILIEASFVRREPVFANSGLDGLQPDCGIIGTDPRYRCRYIHVQTDSELWLKENQINVAVTHLTWDVKDWQNLMWCDSDIHFLRPNWVGETIHKLQHYKFLQPFTHARDLGPNYEMLDQDYPHANGLGFVEAWKRGLINSTLTEEIKKDLREIGTDIAKLEKDFLQLIEDVGGDGYYGTLRDGKRVFPGLAMACTRQAYEDVGGLFEPAVWGGGDWHMSHALIEKTEGMMRNDLHRNYKKLVNQWYQKCRTHIRRNVGVVEGSVVHHWHGKKTGRGYNAKHELLARFGFDPLRHLKKNAQGLFMLHDDRSTAVVQIRDMMRRIAKERNEDSVDI